MMINWQVKAIAAAVMVALLGGILWHDHWMTKRYNDERSMNLTLEGRVSELLHAAQVDQRISAELATFRLQQHADFKAFDEKVQAAKITREVHYVTANGDQAVCVERDRAEYRRLYNEAVTGAANPTSVR